MCTGVWVGGCMCTGVCVCVYTCMCVLWVVGRMRDFIIIFFFLFLSSNCPGRSGREEEVSDGLTRKGDEYVAGRSKFDISHE